MSARTITLALDGLNCASCVARAEKALAAVPGVASVETYRSTRVLSDLGDIVLGVSDATRLMVGAAPGFAFARVLPDQQGATMAPHHRAADVVVDNRILPHGYLDLAARREIAAALGAGPDLAEDAGATAVGDDPDYLHGGADTLTYRVPLGALAGASVAEALHRPARK